jgi:VanZ family protein
LNCLKTNEQCIYTREILGNSTREDFFMRIIFWLAFFAYLALLTALLLSPDPASMMGLKRIPWFPGDDIFMHICALLMLSALLHAIRWPKPLNRTLVVLLLVYGVTTESLQFYVPGRTVQLKDYFDNCLGVALGSGIYWYLHRKWHAWNLKKDQFDE